MTGYIDKFGEAIKVGDTILYDGLYTVVEDGLNGYYLKSHHEYKPITPFNEDVNLTQDEASKVVIIRGSVS